MSQWRKQMRLTLHSQKKWHNRLTCVPCSWVLSHIHIQPIDCSNIHHYQSISCCHRDGSVQTDVSNLLQGDKRIMTHKARQILEIIIAIINHLVLYHISHWKWKEAEKYFIPTREQGRVLGTSWCISLPTSVSKPSHNWFFQYRFLPGLILSPFENQYLIPFSK